MEAYAEPPANAAAPPATTTFASSDIRSHRVVRVLTTLTRRDADAPGCSALEGPPPARQARPLPPFAAGLSGPSVRGQRVKLLRGRLWPHASHCRPRAPGGSGRCARSCHRHPHARLERLELFQRLRCGVDVGIPILARRDELAPLMWRARLFGAGTMPGASCGVSGHQISKASVAASFLTAATVRPECCRNQQQPPAVRSSTKLEHSPHRLDRWSSAAPTARRGRFRKLLLSNSRTGYAHATNSKMVFCSTDGWPRGSAVRPSTGRGTRATHCRLGTAPMRGLGMLNLECELAILISQRALVLEAVGARLFLVTQL